MRTRVLSMVLVAACGAGTGSPSAPGPSPQPVAPAPSSSASEPASPPSNDPVEPAERKPPKPEPCDSDSGSDSAERDHELDLLDLPPSRSTSIGSPTHGRLDGGVALPLQAPGLLFLPRKDPGSRYGTVELVQGLVRAAAAVDGAEPGAVATVGDLSREAGGDISGHASHRSGRDVDVLFYLRRESDDTPFVPSKFIPLDPRGRGTDYGDLADPADDIPVRIDLPRTWGLVAGLVADEAADVQSILVVEHLRALLLEEAARVGAPAAVVQRFSEVTCQPRFPHDDHMHIRVFCSADDIAAGCEDTPPLYPWRRRELAEVGTTSVRAGTAPKAEATPRPKLKTLEQARAEAGPMHEDVVQFLDRRKAWASKPHPGRRWCR